MAIMCSGKKCSIVYSLFILIAMVTVVWFIWFGSDALQGKSGVENNLNKLSQQLSDIGNSYNKNIKLTHGVIEAGVWGVSRRSVVHNVKLEITGKTPENMANFTVELGDVAIYADQYNPKKTLIEISGSINFYQYTHLVNSLNFSEPLVYSYLQTQPGSPPSFQNNIILPKKITLFTHSQEATPAEGTEMNSLVSGGKEEKFSASFTVNPIIEFVSTGMDSLSSVSYDLSGLTVASGGRQKIISFGTLKSQFNEEDGDDEGKKAGKYSFVADDVMLYKDEAVTKPYTFNINTNLVFDDVKKGLSATESSSDVLKNHFNDNLNLIENRDVTLNNVTLSNPDFQMRATGNFSNTAGDPLPSGAINIDIDHLQGFLGSELVAIEGKDLVESGLIKILGQPLTGQDQVAFTLKREKNGTLYVGNTTFEELVASVLSGSVIGNSPSGGRYPDTQAPVGVSESGGGRIDKPDDDAGKVDLPDAVQKQ